MGALGGRADVMALFDPRRGDRIGHGGTFNANPLTMAAGLATLDELTPERYDELGLSLRAWRRRERTNRGLGDRGRLALRIELPDPSRLPDLHVGLLANGILMTPRGVGCLSTPMTSVEVDAFVEALASAAA